MSTGTAAAFVTTTEDPDINQPTIDYHLGNFGTARANLKTWELAP